MTAQTGFRSLPVNGGTPRQVAEIVNRMLTGGLNIGGQVTLTAGSSTTVTDGRVSGGSRIVLQPTNEEASLLARVYIQSKAKGSFVIAHADAAGTETFDYIIIG